MAVGACRRGQRAVGCEVFEGSGLLSARASELDSKRIGAFEKTFRGWRQRIVDGGE
jgi:hypothetical protein